MLLGYIGEQGVHLHARPYMHICICSYITYVYIWKYPPMDPINLPLLLYLLLLLHLFYYSALLNLASRRTNQMVYITQEPL